LFIAKPAEAEMPVEEIIETKTEKEIILEYFKDIPILQEVARCESTYRQHKEDGTVLKGIVNNKDIGAFQINTYYHLQTATKLGLDIYSLEGNLAYARYLYNNQGTSPWSASQGCWGGVREVVV
jgi:hypothetical protein